MKTEFDTNFNGGIMEANSMMVELNMPPASKEYKKNYLPPYGPRKSFLVDEYENCPESWPRSEIIDGVLFKSYFVPVKEGRGLWLDFNNNDYNSNYISALISIQGVNAITGQKLKDEDIFISQFDNTCPIHNEPFGIERYCEQCGFKWPKQNYLSNAAQPHGQFWIDGFRTQDGQIRQFVFTEDEMKSVAANIIGKKRCWAIGIAFYESKEPKSISMNYSGTRTMDFSYSGQILEAMPMCKGFQNNGNKISGYYSSNTVYANTAINPEDFEESFESLSVMEESPRKSIKRNRELTNIRKLEIGAGIKIDQKIWDDKNPIEFWKEKPSAVILINYVHEDICKEILQGPKKDFTNEGEGFLSGIPKV